jgi:hypothetical protein
VPFRQAKIRHTRGKRTAQREAHRSPRYRLPVPETQSPTCPSGMGARLARKVVTADQVAEHLNGRRTGAGKWQAKCPGHADRSPSLSIKEGKDGRVLVKCWAGCELSAVLKACGLTLRNLFPDGPPPSYAQLKAAAEKRECKAAATAKERALLHRLVARREKLSAVVRELGSKLASRPGDDALATLFHLACDRLHAVEHEVEGFTSPSFVNCVYFVPAQHVGREENHGNSAYLTR